MPRGVVIHGAVLGKGEMPKGRCFPSQWRREGASVFSPGIAVAADGSPAAVTVLCVPCRTWNNPYTLLVKKVFEGALERC